MKRHTSISGSINKHKGFTLIEMLIGIVIMGIAISMLSVSMNQSVRNQEKMRNLLGVYQMALSSKNIVIEQIEQQQLSGTYQNGNVSIQWRAEQLEEAREAPLLVVDLGQYSTPSFTIKKYNVTTTIESPNARRVYQFIHTVDRHDQEGFF